MAFLFPLSAFAQQEDSISNREDTIHQTVSQNRRLLLDQFYAARLDSVSLLLDSIELHHRDQPLLFPAERLLLYYWIERYDAIDSLALYFDDFCEKTAANPPPEQMIWNAFSYYSQEKADTLVAWIDQTGCSDEVFDFRMRLLKTMLQNELEDQSTVNQEIRSFIAQYSFRENEISTVATEQAEHHEPDSPWRVGVGIGLGTVSTSGKIANYLSPKICMSFDMNVNYERWYFSLLLQAAFSKLKLDMPYKKGDGVWEAGKSANIVNFDLSVGYSVIDSRFLRMSPFVGIALSDCSPSETQIEKDDTLKDAGISGGFANIIGLDTDIKLYQMINSGRKKNVLTSLNVRINYIPSMFNNVNARYSGNMLFVTFGVRMDVSGL
jgi:hypothetical protein